mmetsp:Transcript_1272/g.2489  ORF Transcript_1272/g.2489 Transcript_1272/m.2489 type:complete len:93 (+) Transcript_1272:746-1024(+)
MAHSGAFQPGDDTIGQELWEFTWTIIDGFQFCPTLREELFPSSTPTTPRPLAPALASLCEASGAAAAAAAAAVPRAEPAREPVPAAALDSPL